MFYPKISLLYFYSIINSFLMQFFETILYSIILKNLNFDVIVEAIHLHTMDLLELRNLNLKDLFVIIAEKNTENQKIFLLFQKFQYHQLQLIE